MNYKLKKAKLDHKEILYNYKILNILDFNKMTAGEKERVNKYIFDSIINHVDNYRLIIVDNKIIGVYCSYIKDNHIFLDEIYIEKEYRNLGIGTNLIKKEIENANLTKMNLKLWVYKDNEKAVNLYKRLGFIIEQDTETRYLMKK